MGITVRSTCGDDLISEGALVHGGVLDSVGGLVRCVCVCMCVCVYYL